MIDPAQTVWHLKSVTYSLPSQFSRVHFADSTCVYTVPFPSLNHSKDLQILPLSFAPGLTHLSVSIWMDPSTQPTLKNRTHYWSVAKLFVLLLPILRRHILKWSAFWLLSLCKHDQTSLNHCTGLFPIIYNCSLLELLGPVENNLADPSTTFSWS